MIVTTSSYAKPSHAAPKKQATAIAKPAKKQGAVATKAAPHVSAAVHGHLSPAKYTARPHTPHLERIIRQLERGHKGHFVAHPHPQKHFLGRKKMPPPGRNYLQKVIPPLVSIPHLPTQNEFIQTEGLEEAIEATPRIHTILPNGQPMGMGSGTLSQANVDDNASPEYAPPRSSVVTHLPAHPVLSDRQRPEMASHFAPDGDKPSQYTSTHGVIITSLSDAGAEAGLSEGLLDKMTRIFAWDIDFATNLHVGDEFIVLYEGENSDEEDIIAAEFISEGRVLTAVRYEDADGNANYYTPEGKAMRKAFLSAPVDYSRITSHFSANRRHPILNRIRAHKGVDYAARIGTPVKSTGDGTIAFMGRKGGYGEVIIVRHGEHFETVYAHLSDYRRDLAAGDPVSQGDVIGYVGQTGLATGPHLHYEFHVDGVHRNPESISSGGGSRSEMSLIGQALQDFKEQTQAAVTQLYSAKAKSLFAKNQPANR